jgi:CheY-like chemotaxis protein/MinD-like ATPase involved in chromosome partitioning or flagellar assembly
MSDKVLIIDDDTDTLRLVGLMLQHQGYSIATASNGEQGIAKATLEQPDVILLDVMMPEMDGYEVTRRLRADPRTQETPILMFTARSLLNDRVAAFEVGVDDYLTKPTNPTDLQMHVRQLLDRAREKKAAATAAPAAPSPTRKIGLLSAHAGMGVSTIAVNLAAALQMRGQAEVILAELTPGQGTLGMELGLDSTRGLSELLQLHGEEITAPKVRAALMRHNCGLQVLPASESPREAVLAGRVEQMEAVFRGLQGLAPYLVVDLGAGLPPWAASILKDCDERIVLTGARPNTLHHTRILMGEIEALGIAAEAVRVVLNHRVRFDTQFPADEAEQTLGHPISVTLHPAPELMMAAARRQLPGVLAMPEDSVAQQFLKMADGLLAGVGAQDGGGTRASDGNELD